MNLWRRHSERLPRLSYKVCATARKNGGLVSEQERVRGEQLKDLSERVQAMANNPQAATYLGFEGVWKEAQQLGVEVTSDITITVASAFIQRPYVSSRIS